MTVIKDKQIYTFPINSGCNSDTESLHLGSAPASDTESVAHNGPVTHSTFLRPVFKGAPTEEHITLKKYSGRKKLRRYQNRCVLQTLAEEDDEESMTVIMEPYRSPFTKLLQNNDALQFWNSFIEKSEEQQAKLIEIVSYHKYEKTYNSIKDKHFVRILSKIKRTLKIKKNLPLEQIRHSENDLINFFKATPTQVYVQFLSTYFERLLLHAIAQYHGLQSLAIVENDLKRVEVFNTSQHWTPADSSLADLVARLRK